jgi:AAA domain
MEIAACGISAGANVVLLPDNDARGREHVQKIAESLKDIASRIRIVTLPELPEKGDIVDWIKAGHTREELDALVEAATDWQAGEQSKHDAGAWKFHTGEPAPPPRSLVKGILPQCGTGLLSGQWGTFKTTVALDLSVSIMADQPFAGRYRIKRPIHCP